MLFISRFIKKTNPMSYKSKVIPVDSLATICSHHSVFPRFMNSSDNKATTRSGIRKYQFKNFFIKRSMPYMQTI